VADPSETTQVARAPADAASGELLTAVQALAAQVGDLKAEVHALRGQAAGGQAAGLPSPDGERPGWDDPGTALRDSGAWVRSLDAPGYRRLSIPWLAIELAFLVAVAVLAAVAGFDAPVIGGVMVVAWFVVALAEWAAARSARRRAALAYGAWIPAPAQAPAQLPEDPSWLEPPSERTALDVASEHESTLTRLPPPADE
jgi:hypothetical protein